MVVYCLKKFLPVCNQVQSLKVFLISLTFEAMFTRERYRTVIVPVRFFGMEKLTIHTGPVHYHTSFGTYSHGYTMVPLRSISRRNRQKKIRYVNKFQTLPNKE